MASSVHVFNRTPRRSGSAMSPLEAITGKKPTLDHLRVFGCPAYSHVPSQQRTKMSPPARKGVFVGYTPNSQSWMVYFPSTRTIISSRSVTFDEEWRPLSPHRPFSELMHPKPGGADPVERDPFLFKAPVTAGIVITTATHLSVLPPQPVAPASSLPSAPEPGSRILPATAVTRSGHRFRVDASPFVPSAGLSTIHECSRCSRCPVACGCISCDGQAGISSPPSGCPVSCCLAARSPLTADGLPWLGEGLEAPQLPTGGLPWPDGDL